jgi:hypothetical protein
VADVGRPTNPSSRAYTATSLFPIGIEAPVKKLYHNCDTEPVSAAQSDFIDDVRLLILRKLLKTKMRPENPAYRPARYFFSNSQVVLGDCAITSTNLPLSIHQEHNSSRCEVK